MRVERGEIRRLTQLSGSLVARDALIVSVPPVDANMVQLRWLIEEGTEVQAGDKIAELDNSPLTGQLENLRTQAKEADNRLSETIARKAGAVAKAAFELEQKTATHDRARISAAVPAEILPAVEVLKRRLELEKAVLELEQAQKSLAAERASGEKRIAGARLERQSVLENLAQLERDLEAMVLVAPRAGIVKLATDFRSGRPLKSGDNVWPGAVVARLPALESLQVEALLFDVDDGRVLANQMAEVRLDAFPHEVLLGKVVTVDALADELSGQSLRRAFRVHIDLEQIDVGRARPGMSVRVDTREPAQAGWLVSRRALWSHADGFFLVSSRGERIEISVGACDPDSCLIEPGPGSPAQALEGLMLRPRTTI